MSIDNEFISKLNDKLKNKTIYKIEKSNDDEAVCKFILTDGSSFILFATDLGAWIKNCKNKHSKKC